MALPASARRIILGATTSLVALAPWWAETMAHARLAHDLTCGGTCGEIGDSDVDLTGLRLWGVSQERPGLTLTAETIRVSPDWDGLKVDVEGLVATVSRPNEPEPVAQVSNEVPARQGAASPARASNRARVPVPIEVHTQGTVTTEIRGATLVLTDPAIAMAPRGPIATTFELQVEAGDLHLASRGRIRANVLPDEREVRARGLLTVADSTVLPLEARLDARRLAAVVGDPDVGTLTVDAPLGDAPVELVADRLPLAAGRILEDRLPGSLGVDLEPARLSGRVTLTRGHGGLHASLDNLRLEHLGLRQHQLSRHDIELASLGIDGDLWTRDGLHGAQLLLGHERAQVHVSGQAGPDGVTLDVQLPETDCQTLVESMPRGTVDMIRGIGLHGSVAGSMHLSFDPDNLGELPAPDLDGSWDRPGELTFEFPFIERCAVEREPPRVDLAGLAGAYRHRFRTDRGEERVRTLAVGAPGYAPLASVLTVARAFVTTEDTRFWEHDGFDREQIERAFWHNLGAGGFSRGASTITQQTARNLWLGIDRSLSRKLQEALLANRLEAHLDKDRILELYVNLIELGPEVHGVTEAARYHFGKRVEDLTILESVYIASLAPAPRALSLRHHRDGIPPEWLDRVKEQTRRMALHGHITWAAYRQAIRQELKLVDPERPA